jgi:hypothetical protein
MKFSLYVDELVEHFWDLDPDDQAQFFNLIGYGIHISDIEKRIKLIKESKEISNNGKNNLRLLTVNSEKCGNE